jgi:membrane fusion protein (multidrug efflux system)
MKPRVLIVIVGALLGACGPQEQAEPETPAEASADEANEQTLVEFVRLGRIDFEESIELVGQTSPLREANISAEVPGRLVRFDVAEGQPVTAGQSVLRLDMSTATASIGQIEAQIRQVEQDLERNEAMVERGLGTQAVVDQLRAQREVLQENITQIRTSIRQGSSTAPISGVVVQTMVEEGEYASPGQPLARIVDISSVKVLVGLPEREIGYVNEGMDVTVRIEATGQELTGRLTRVGIEANPANRTFPLEILVDNAAGALRAGMRASVVIPRERIPGAIVIPRDAVLQGINSPEVLVYDAAVGAVVREITVGPGRGSFVTVTAGLSENDQLITRGHRGLVPGEPVRAVDLGPCCGEQFERFIGGGEAAPVQE